MITITDNKLFDKIVEITHINRESPFDDISLKYEGGNDIFIEENSSSYFHPAYSNIPNWIIRKLWKASQKNNGDIHFVIKRTTPIEILSKNKNIENDIKEDMPLKNLKKIKNPFLEGKNLKTISKSYLEWFAQYAEPIIRYNEDSEYYKKEGDNILYHRTKQEMHEYFHNMIQLQNLFIDAQNEWEKKEGKLDLDPFEIPQQHFNIFWNDLSRAIERVKSFKEKDFEDKNNQKIFENIAYYKFFSYIYLPQYTKSVKKL